MRTVFKYLLPFKYKMTLGLFIKVVGTVVELFLPYILSHILKNVVVDQDVTKILLWGGAMVLCALVACLCNITANRMAAKVSCNFSEKLRQDLFDKTLRLSAAQTDKFTIPSLESRITTDTYHVHGFVGMMQRMGVRAPILLIGGISVTLIMDSFLSLAMISILPFIFLAVYFISKKGTPLYTKVQASVDKMVRIVREDIQGIRVIKALSKNEYEHNRFDTANKALVKDETKAGTTMNGVNPIMNLLMNVGIVLVIALSANRVADHRSDPETVIAFMQYFTQISMAIMFVGRMFVMYTKCAASAGRIAEVLNCENDIKTENKADFPNLETENHIVFKDVNFGYTSKYLNLKNISFELKKGGNLGIIGATGSGKSTLVKLLLRFYDVSSGGIYINGEDIRTLSPEVLYKKFGTAMQYDFLYNDSILENIRFGRNISDEDIFAAAKIAQAAPFIEGFEDGYEHILSQKGTNISGGQKQRILISRALASKPEILVLDDSSSALDYKTDANLRKALAENLKDTTLITVAQRVSSVKDCDLILVLENGEIFGAGSHDYLLESCTEYKEISDSQMGGAFVE
ncbi:MAG: ABC transporter ATP-binding protein [Clostridia bacterium]|nr:ABC transporter ATP-binding protein [Clostridia bacterium]